MRFRPSVYSDVAATAPAAPTETAPTALSTAATAATALSELVSAGTSAWDATSAARMAKWQKKAKKKAKKRAASTPTVAAATAAPAPAPIAAKPATDWTRWGLIGMGTLAVGVIAYLLLRPKPDEPKSKKNPPKPAQRGAFIRTPPKRRVPKVIDVEAETVEEEPSEPMDDEDDGAFAGADEPEGEE